MFEVLLGLACASALPALAASEEPVARAAREFLLDRAAQAGLVQPEVSLKLIAGDGAPLACATAPRVEALDTRHPSRMRYAAVCPASGARAEYVVRAELSAQVVVAPGGIAARRPIAGHEVTLERRPLAGSAEVTSDPEDVIGQSARRAIRAGQVVDRKLLVEPVLVRRGAAVRIVARNGPVLVTAAGEAMELGHAGDIVNVRNTTTGNVIRARVTGSNEVEPADMPITPSAPQSAR